MPRVSKLLKVSKVKHSELGEILELYTPASQTGQAYFITYKAVPYRDGHGDLIHAEVETGCGLRLTKKTARALAVALYKLAKEKK